MGIESFPLSGIPSMNNDERRAISYEEGTAKLADLVRQKTGLATAPGGTPSEAYIAGTPGYFSRRETKLYFNVQNPYAGFGKSIMMECDSRKDFDRLADIQRRLIGFHL